MERRSRLDKKRIVGLRDLGVDVCVSRRVWSSSRKEIKNETEGYRGFYTQDQFHYQPIGERDRQEE